MFATIQQLYTTNYTDQSDFDGQNSGHDYMGTVRLSSFASFYRERPPCHRMSRHLMRKGHLLRQHIAPACCALMALHTALRASRSRRAFIHAIGSDRHERSGAVTMSRLPWMVQ